MTTLVTGGAGFIGSRLVMALRQHGDTVIILDNFDPFYDPRLKRANVAVFETDPCVTLIEGDIRDKALIERVMTDNGVTRIAHLAGLANVRASTDAAAAYIEVNTGGSVNLLDAARHHQVEQFIQASTSSVYGDSSAIPFTEDAAADQPLAPYPASKRAAEMMGHAYHHLFGLNVTCLRFFNVYGPNGRPDMMPLRVLRAVRDSQPITLFGGGVFKRDWTYIDDIVAGIIAALNCPLGYKVINLGCGDPLAMTPFVDIVEALVGKAAIRVNVPAPPSDPPITYCNNGRARQLLGFDPKTDLYTGLTNTWEWLQHYEPR